MNRREFNRLTLQLGMLSLTSSLPLFSFSRKAFAQSVKKDPQFFILIHAANGWDTSLAMNPWTASQRPDEQDYFIEYRQDELLEFGNYKQGPAMAALKPYFDRMSIINGLYMSATDGGHDSAALYAQSGNGQGDLGLLSAELEGKFLQSPYGILANTSVYAAQERRMIWSFDSAKALSTSGGLMDFDSENSELARARIALLQNKDKVSKYIEMISKNGSQDGNIIAAAFASGLSQSVVINNANADVDTHQNHPTRHLQGLSKVIADFKNLLDCLAAVPGVDADGHSNEQRTLLDQTTIMVVSEFTRTPALNTSKGKDHNPQSNSAILFGPGLKAGVAGESLLVTRAHSRTGISYLAGMPLDKATGQPVARRENTFILRPENMVATVVRSMGFDPAQISPDLGKAQLLTSILKS